MFKRILLFSLTNIAIIITLSIFASLLGVGRYTSQYGINYNDLFVFCLFWGVSGAFISLAISRFVAKWSLGIKLISTNSASEHDWLVQMVHEVSRSASLPEMPQVGIYDSEEINAFATGPTKSKSLVAFSSGLLSKLNREEIKGVVGHEIAHIQNGDMITMTLIQGVINTFVIFFARIIAYAASNAVDEKLSRLVWYISIIFFEIVFGLLGMLITCWFSRKREFRADAGSTKLVGAAQMKAALLAIKNIKTENASALPQSISALAINGNTSRFMFAFSTHPNIDERIAALD